jgi:cbb3-type cytochrome oxidase subunit 1
MKGVAFYFFVTGVIAVTIGMIWGIQMSATNSFTMAPAHAHLNLVGWVTFGLFGVYYHLVPAAAEARLAMIHYLVALAGLVLMIVGLVVYFAEGPEIIVVIGSFLTAGSMLIFLYTVARHGMARDALSAVRQGWSSRL